MWKFGRARARVHYNVAQLEGTGPGEPVLLKGTGPGYLLTTAHKMAWQIIDQTSEITLSLWLDKNVQLNRGRANKSSVHLRQTSHLRLQNDAKLAFISRGSLRRILLLHSYLPSQITRQFTRFNLLASEG